MDLIRRFSTGSSSQLVGEVSSTLARASSPREAISGLLKLLSRGLSGVPIEVEISARDSGKLLLLREGSEGEVLNHSIKLLDRPKTKALLRSGSSLKGLEPSLQLIVSCISALAISLLAEEEKLQSLYRQLPRSVRLDLQPVDIPEALSELLTEFGSLLGSSYSSLWILDRGETFDLGGEIVEETAIVALATAGAAISELRRERLSLRQGSHPFSRILKRGQIERIEGIGSHPFYKESPIAKRLGLATLISVPLRRNEAGLSRGLLNLYFRDSPSAGSSLAPLIPALAALVDSQLEIALLRDRADLFKKIISLAHFTPGDSYTQFWERIVREIQSEVGAEAVSLFLRKARSTPELSLAATTGLEGPKPTYRAAEGLTGKVLAKQRALHIFDLGERPFPPKSRDHTKSKATNLLAVPVGTLGVLRCVNKTRPSLLKRFSGFDQEAFSHLGKVLGAYAEEQLLLEDLRKTQESKEIYLQTLRHEIRGPADKILDDAFLLADLHRMRRPEPALADKLYDRIAESIELVAMLARGTDALEETLKLSPEALNLTQEVVMPLTRFFENQTRVSGVDVELEFLGLPPVLADKSYTYLVFFNLFRNALKYQDKSEARRYMRIERGPDRPEGAITLNFEDNGIGLDPLEGQRVFEKYFRGARALKTNVTGSGLGLAIASNIMRHQDGKIEISSYEKPTRFSLTFQIGRSDHD